MSDQKGKDLVNLCQNILSTYKNFAALTLERYDNDKEQSLIFCKNFTDMFYSLLEVELHRKKDNFKETGSCCEEYLNSLEPIVLKYDESGKLEPYTGGGYCPVCGTSCGKVEFPLKEVDDE